MGVRVRLVAVWLLRSVDQFFPVYDPNCGELCLLYGLAGNTECQGVEFYDNAVEVASWPFPG